MGIPPRHVPYEHRGMRQHGGAPYCLTKNSNRSSLNASSKILTLELAPRPHSKVRLAREVQPFRGVPGYHLASGNAPLARHDVRFRSHAAVWSMHVPGEPYSSNKCPWFFSSCIRINRATA